MFGNGQLYHTSAKGLHHAGVYQIPYHLEVKLVVSSDKLADETLPKIIDNINAQLKFLYKNFVKSISEADVITFDYSQFSEEALEDRLKERQCSYIVHLINDPKEIKQPYSSNIEKITLTNTQVIETLKKNRFKFDVVNSLEKYTVSNSLLKLGVKNKAIPWKINCVDTQDRHHIFIGIDLGHNHIDKLSNLTLTVIDNSGCLIKTYFKKNLKLDEVISYEELFKAFKEILSQSLNQYQSITIHRDGI